MKTWEKTIKTSYWKMCFILLFWLSCFACNVSYYNNNKLIKKIKENENATTCGPFLFWLNTANGKHSHRIWKVLSFLVIIIFWITKIFSLLKFNFGEINNKFDELSFLCFYDTICTSWNKRKLHINCKSPIYYIIISFNNY